MARGTQTHTIRNTFSIFAFFFSLLAVVAHAQAPTVDWVEQYGTPERDYGVAVASDALAVYAGGFTDGALDGPHAGSSSDAYLRKYDLSGNVIWAQQFGDIYQDSLAGISLHGSHIYTVGSTQGPAGPFLGQTLPGNGDGFLQKYDFDGNEIWTRVYGSVAFDVGRDISTHNTGVYVVGSASASVNGQPTGTSVDAIVVKYDFDGNVVWTSQFFGSPPPTYSHAQQAAHAIAVDDSGVYVGGDIFGVFPNNNHVGGFDAFLRKYDHAGNEVWTREFGTAGPEGVFSIATDPTGVYVAGNTNDALPGQTYIGPHRDIFIRKYDFNGNELWTRQFGTESTDEIITYGNKALATDNTGVYITGRTARTLGPTSVGGLDPFVRKYDQAGNEIWTVQFGTTTTDTNTIISVGPGGIFVAGGTFGVFDGETSAGDLDIFLARLAPANTAPVAEAGDNQRIHGSGRVYLDGSGSFDQETASEDLLYAWEFTSVPPSSSATLIGAETTYPMFDVDVLGDYIVNLIVTDEGGLSSEPDEVTISSENVAPNADAGLDQGAYVGALVILNGSGSFDEDEDPLTYLWTMINKPQGSIAVLTDADQVFPSFSPDLPGAYDVELTVNDGYADSDPDSVTVLVSSAGDYVCERTTETLNIIAGWPDSSFRTKGDRTAFGNFLTKGCTDSQKGNTNQARHKLEQALERTDGCMHRGAPDTQADAPLAKDYIINCPDQQVVYPLIEEALNALLP